MTSSLTKHFFFIYFILTHSTLDQFDYEFNEIKDKTALIMFVPIYEVTSIPPFKQAEKHSNEVYKYVYIDGIYLWINYKNLKIK